jgi:hypothetical protein
MTTIMKINKILPKEERDSEGTNKLKLGLGHVTIWLIVICKLTTHDNGFRVYI